MMFVQYWEYLKAFAYKIIKGYNEELKERGFLVIPGKISTRISLPRRFMA
ncbi:MAG: hypothetical protein ACLR0U_23240 [Enterocloster clostridioformis]